MNMLKVGDKVPDFSAKDQDGNTINLSDYKGKKLIVFFYPKANTPGCTAEACNYIRNGGYRNNLSGITTGLRMQTR